jgi:hypothetical protein
VEAGESESWGGFQRYVQRRGKLRIVTLGISGGRPLTRPFRDARRFPSLGLWPVPRATRKPRKFAIRPSFKGHSVAVPNPNRAIRHFCTAVVARNQSGPVLTLRSTQSARGSSVGLRAGTCACMHTNHFFALGVEDMEVQIEHLWQTTFAHGALPETRVRKYDGIEYKVGVWAASIVTWVSRGYTGALYKRSLAGCRSTCFVESSQRAPRGSAGCCVSQAIFQAGTPPRATLREWLEWMEVDLDVPINQGKNTQWVQTTDEYKSALLGPEGVDRFDFPRPRLTGKSPMDHPLARADDLSGTHAHTQPPGSPNCERGWFRLAREGDYGVLQPFCCAGGQ